MATQLLPFVGPFVGLMLPLPFIYFSYGLDLGYSIKFTVTVVLALAILGTVAGYPDLSMICLEFGALGLFLSELFKKRLTIGYTVFFGCLLMLGLGLLLLVLSSISKEMGPFDMIRAYLESNLKASMESYNGMGLSEQEASEIQAYGKVFISVVLKIYPALMVIGSALVVWLNVLFTRSLFRIRGLNYPEFYDLDRWQAPELLVWLLIGSGFALFLPAGIIKSISINCLLILMVVYLFQGVSILSFFIKKFNVPHWLRGIIYFFIIVQQFFLIILALVGLFDQWVDFRKIHKLQHT